MVGGSLVEGEIFARKKALIAARQTAGGDFCTLRFRAVCERFEKVQIMKVEQP